jgi:hypothetical protein
MLDEMNGQRRQDVGHVVRRRAAVVDHPAVLVEVVVLMKVDAHL